MKSTYICTILLCLSMFMWTGCATIKYQGIEYTRIGAQQFDDLLLEVIDPNGVTISLIIEGQKSDFELGFNAAGLTAGGGR